jgi:antitoxin (DNA-binding transcriptional repressor) of toxin-antitoxin stability system
LEDRQLEIPRGELRSGDQAGAARQRAPRQPAVNLPRASAGFLALVLAAGLLPARAALPAAEVEAGLRFYDSIGILKPAAEATLFNNDGAVEVAVALSPPLRAGDRIVLTLDGRPAATLAGLRAKLTGIDRGEHTLVAQTVDRDGDALIASPPVIFNVWRASRLFPNRKQR